MHFCCVVAYLTCLDLLSRSIDLYATRLLQEVKLAHFGKHNCYQLLSDVIGMPDISLLFILLSESSKILP